MASPDDPHPAPPPGRVPLSAEEVRGLIGDEPENGFGPAAEPTRPATRRVLVLLRGDDEARTLRGVLGSLDFAVSLVRNPFNALDQLRLRAWVGVISDFSLWADGGALLFQRMSACPGPAPVVFVCGGTDDEAAALAAGAAGVLRRPLKPTDIERVSTLFGAAAADVSPPPGIRAPSVAQPERPAAPSQGGAQGGTRGEEEVVWLRFFFEARIAMRSAAPGMSKIDAILACFERVLGCACGAGIAGVGSWWVLARPGSRAVLERLACALDGSASDGTGGNAPSPGSLSVSWTVGGRPAAFAAGPGLIVPETFLAELKALLEEAGPIGR